MSIFFFLLLLLQLLLPPGVCGWEAKQEEEEEKGWRESFSINLPFIFNLLSRTAETNYLVGGVVGGTSRNSTDKRTLIENYDLVSLAIDEIVDDGIILEVDPVVVAGRVTRPPAQDVVGVKGIEFSEQGIMNAWELLKTKGVERIRQF